MCYCILFCNLKFSPKSYQAIPSTFFKWFCFNAYFTQAWSYILPPGMVSLEVSNREVGTVPLMRLGNSVGEWVNESPFHLVAASLGPGHISPEDSRHLRWKRECFWQQYRAALNWPIMLT